MGNRETGLRQGGTYWYYYEVDGEEWCDPRAPSTSRCPMMPGQEVNILEVPIERPVSRLSRTMTAATMGVEEVEERRDVGVETRETEVAEKARRRHKMLRPAVMLLRKKRPGSETIVGMEGMEERREKVKREWIGKGIESLTTAVGAGRRRWSRGREEKEMVRGEEESPAADDDRVPEGDHPASIVAQHGNWRALLTPDVRKVSALPTAPRPLTKGSPANTADKILNYTIRDSPTLLASPTTLSASQLAPAPPTLRPLSRSRSRFETPPTAQQQFTTETSPPELYHSSTSSLDTSPESTLQTPQKYNHDLHHNLHYSPNFNLNHNENPSLGLSLRPAHPHDRKPPSSGINMSNKWLDFQPTSHQHKRQVSQADANEYIHPAMRTDPAAYSRHTLTLGSGAPFEPGPGMTVASDAMAADVVRTNAQQQHQQPLQLREMHAFFKQDERHGSSRLSRTFTGASIAAAQALPSGTGHENEAAHHRTASGQRSGTATPAAIGLGLDFSPDFSSGLGFNGMPPPYVHQEFTLDLDAVNERLLNGASGRGRGIVETGFDGEEFGWLGGVVM